MLPRSTACRHGDHVLEGAAAGEFLIADTDPRQRHEQRSVALLASFHLDQEIRVGITG